MEQKPTDFEINSLLVRSEVDWEDLNLNGQAVAWGDGYNWYNYDAVGDNEESFRLLEKYRLNVTPVTSENGDIVTWTIAAAHGFVIASRNLKYAIALTVYNIKKREIVTSPTTN